MRYPFVSHFAPNPPPPKGHVNPVEVNLSIGLVNFRILN
jgi:hypothetical protein